MDKLEEMRKKPLLRHMRILIPDVDFLFRAVEQLTKSTPLLRNLYTSMFLGEGRNEDLPPQVQYWLQEIPKFLDSLDLDIRELVESE